MGSPTDRDESHTLRTLVTRPILVTLGGATRPARVLRELLLTGQITLKDQLKATSFTVVGDNAGDANNAENGQNADLSDEVFAW
jgi:hypothetical protein